MFSLPRSRTHVSTAGGCGPRSKQLSFRGARLTIAGVFITAVVAATIGAPSAGSSPAIGESVVRQPLKNVRATPSSAGMPVVVSDPSLKGNVLSFKVKATPWRTDTRNPTAAVDRLGGRLQISRKGVDLSFPSHDTQTKSGALYLMNKAIPTRVINRDGVFTISAKLPRKVADSLRKVPKSQLSERVNVTLWHDKDTNPSIGGFEVRQFAAAFTSPSTPAKRKAKPRETRSGTRSIFMEEPTPVAPVPAPFALFNGSPFDLTVTVTAVQCTTGTAVTNQVIPAGTTFMWDQQALLANSQDYNSNPSETASDSFNEALTSADEAAQAGLEAGIAHGVSKGVLTAGAYVAVDLVSVGVKALVTPRPNCSMSGSAWQINWTATDVNPSQTAGNINYWVPAYGSTAALGSASTANLPVTAGMGITPLAAYNATSANGLAVSLSQLQSQLYSTGSLVMAMLNSNVLSVGPYGCLPDSMANPCTNTYTCNLSNQQQTNPSSTSTSTNFGASAFTGGISADWSACSGSTQMAYNRNGSEDPDGENATVMSVGATVLLGFGNTTITKGGPYAAGTATSAASVGLCAATAAPCITAASVPGTSSTTADSSLSTGCTVGDWNFATPWNAKTYSLSNPPASYSSVNQMASQLVYRGVSSSGASLIYAMPTNVSASTITGGFSPTGSNLWMLTNTDLQQIQNTIPGGYVSQWGCVMSANTQIPQGLTGGANNALNLSWNGTPVTAWINNPAGNLTSPPGSGGSSGSGGATTPSTIAAPTNVVALGGSGLVAAAWTPITATTSGIQSVTYVATASSGQSCSTSGTTCTILSVPNGTPVTVTVTAASGALTSAASAPSAPTTPTAAAVPPSPATPVQNVMANYGAGIAAVSWNAVTTASGAIAAVSYTARTNSGQTCTTTTTNCNIVNVPAGTPVTVQVTTNTSQGAAPPSVPTAPVVMAVTSPTPTTPAPPAQLELDASAPTSVKANDDFTIKVSVGPGAPDGSATVTLYKDGKTTATLGRVSVLNGKGNNNLKIPKKTSHGSYSLRVSFTANGTGQIVKSAGAIKVT